MSKSKKYVGVNIQYPISRLILSGKKKMETRTYPLPEKHRGKTLLMIETPGRTGKFKARIVAKILFGECFPYKSKRQFYADFKKHLVDAASPWAWKDKAKWGWPILNVKKLEPQTPDCKRIGLKFTLNLSLRD